MASAAGTARLARRSRSARTNRRPCVWTADRDGTDELVANHQGVADHGQVRPPRIRLYDVRIPLRPGLVVVDEGTRARGGGEAEDARIGPQLAADLALGKPGARPGPRARPAPRRAARSRRGRRRRARPPSRDDGQPLLQTDRHEDLLHDSAQRVQMAHPLMRLLVQARIVERQRGLVRKGLGDANLLLRRRCGQPDRPRRAPRSPRP